MLGDDASMAFMELIKRILDILKSVAEGNRGPIRSKEPKKPKIKIGKLSKKDFTKLRDSGTNFGYVTIPKDKLAQLEKDVKKLGGSFFATKVENGNNAIVAVPQQYMELVSTAMRHIVADEMCTNPEKLKLKDGAAKVSEEDMKLTADILRSHDIPVYSFKSADGKYMNVVPDEFDGQYEAAMREVREISEKVKNIEITRYEQTSPLDSLDVFACKMSPEAAKALNAVAKYKSLDVQFAKDGEQIIAKYPAAIAEEVEKAQREFSDCVEESEKYLIDVKDNTVTMDVGKLLMGEDESAYFVRVPNTAARDYLRLNKSEVELINGDKTIAMKLDMKRKYKIYDSEGNLKSERTGAQLSRSYNTKSQFAKKTTEVVKYGVGMERVELYNKEKDKLISLGIDSADKMRSEMIEQGISAGAADLLIKDIAEKLPENYKSIYNFSAEKTEIVYADIPNIGEYLAQSQLSEQLIGKVECFGEIPMNNGGKCCVFDKSENRFTIMPILPRAEIIAKLSEMGYSELCAKEIAERVVLSYRDTDKVKDSFVIDEHKPVVPMSFDTNNPELTNMMYHKSEYCMLIVQESGEQYKYMDIDKGTPMADVEKALLKNFDIKDELSAAVIMKQLAKDGIIELPPIQKVADISVGRISSNFVEVTFGGQSAVMPKDKMESRKLEEIGIDKKTADSVIKAFAGAEKKEKSTSGQTLQQLKDFASKAIKNIEIEKSKVKEFAKEKINRKSGQER